MFQGNDCQRGGISFFPLFETKTSISFHLSQRKKIKFVFTKMSAHSFNRGVRVYVTEVVLWRGEVGGMVETKFEVGDTENRPDPDRGEAKIWGCRNKMPKRKGKHLCLTLVDLTLSSLNGAARAGWGPGDTA